MLNNYTNEQIQFAFPEYYTEIRPSLEKITEIVDGYKINKSIEKATETTAEGELETIQNSADQFLTEDVAEKLQEYLSILHSREASLIETRARDKKVAVKDKVLIPVITGVIGAVIATLLTTYL